MSEPMSDPQLQSESPQRHSLSRVLAVVIPVAIIGVIAYVVSRNLESQARDELANNSFKKILAASVATASAEMKYPDKDGDLVADSPDDPSKCIKPDVLVFSYVASDVEKPAEPAWKEFLAALKQKTGHE